MPYLIHIPSVSKALQSSWEKQGHEAQESRNRSLKLSSFAVPSLHSHVCGLRQPGPFSFSHVYSAGLQEEHPHSCLRSHLPSAIFAWHLSGPPYSSPNCMSVGLTWLQMGPQGESGQPLGQVHLLSLLTSPLCTLSTVWVWKLSQSFHWTLLQGYEGLFPILIWRPEGSSWQSHIMTVIDVPRGRWYSQFSLGPASYSWLSLPLAQL